MLRGASCIGLIRPSAWSRRFTTATSTPTWQVFCFGDGTHGALGKCEDSRNSYFPEPVEGLGSVAGVAAGHYHTLALGECGTLCAWGRNNEGQLGPGREGEPGGRPLPVQLPPGRGPWKHIAASGVVSAAVDAEGAVWTWGASKRGQLGHGHGALSSPHPKCVPGLEGVVGLALGWGHALALTEDGTVHLWGFIKGSAAGSSGAGAQATSAEEDMAREAQAMAAGTLWSPTPLALPRRTVEVACGLDHGLLRLEGGEVLAFGDNALGQLGAGGGGGGGGAAPDPAPVAVAPPVEWLACGASHTLAAGVDGMMWAWGWNGGGQLGVGVGGPEFSPDPLAVVSPAGESVPRWASAAAGRAHSAAVDAEGRLFTWGSGRGGRLGHGSSQDHQVPAEVEELIGFEVGSVQCGHDHTVVLARKR